MTTRSRALTAAEQQLIAASNRFGLKVFCELERTTRDPVPNLFVSPLSVTMALGMDPAAE
jgi:serine protease inhibitor